MLHEQLETRAGEISTQNRLNLTKSQPLLFEKKVDEIKT